MRNFEELRRQLLDRLDTGRELEEAEIREAIDNLVLEEGRTCLLSLKEKTELRNALFYSVRGLDVSSRQRRICNAHGAAAHPRFGDILHRRCDGAAAG